MAIDLGIREVAIIVLVVIVLLLFILMLLGLIGPTSEQAFIFGRETSGVLG